MLPLTTRTWSGLPLYTCPTGQEVRLVDVEFGDDMLVLWRNAGTVVEVRRSAAQRWAYTSRTGHFDFVASGRFDSISFNPPSVPMLIVGLPRALVRELLDDSHAPLRTLPRESQLQFQLRSLSKLVSALEAHNFDGEPLGSAYTRALSAVIVDRIAGMDESPAQGGHQQGLAALRVIVQLIDTQLDNLPGLAALAALAGMNTNQFLKWFKRHFDVTPHQYIMRKRIERAMNVLDQSNQVSLTTLALQLGFNSHAHFTSVFRSQTGQTPSAYRRQRMAAEDC